MKYIFDVDERNNKFQIRLELQKGNAFNASAYQIIECSEESPNWPISLEILLVDIIDNMRLTVQERNEAYRNSNILVQYLKYSNPTPVEDTRHQMMIVENEESNIMHSEEK
jgi:hypothetical protein